MQGREQKRGREQGDIEAEIANLKRLREQCADGSEWAVKIDIRLRWLLERLNKFRNSEQN